MKIASWNVAKGLSDPERAPYLHEGLKKLDADLVFLPEAFNQAGEQIDPAFYSQLGYDEYSVEYADNEPHPSGLQYIMALSRVACNAQVSRLGGRNTLKVTTAIDGDIAEITGAHFDDRNEALRLDMVTSFIAQSKYDTPSAVIGDLNAMHGEDVRARLLSSDVARKFANKLRHNRMRSLATRLTDMASGDTMEIFEREGFKDVDHKHRSTMLMAGFAIAQLDHVMINDLLRAENFEALKLNGSDHKAISVDISMA